MLNRFVLFAALALDAPCRAAAEVAAVCDPPTYAAHCSHATQTDITGTSTAWTAGGAHKKALFGAHSGVAMPTGADAATCMDTCATEMTNAGWTTGWGQGCCYWSTTACYLSMNDDFTDAPSAPSIAYSQCRVPPPPMSAAPAPQTAAMINKKTCQYPSGVTHEDITIQCTSTNWACDVDGAPAAEDIADVTDATCDAKCASYVQADPTKAGCCYLNRQPDASPAQASCTLYVGAQVADHTLDIVWAQYYDGTPTTPPSAAAATTAASTNGDPHLHFAHGGTADFRGRNGTFYVLHSAPGIQSVAQSMDTDFILPSYSPVFVEGTFFTRAAWTLRGTSQRKYGVVADANDIGYKVFDAQTGTMLTSKRGVWQEWRADGVQAMYMQQTLVIRANGWEVNATRKPIYNRVRGPSMWRFDMAMRKLDGTRFERLFGKSSETCFPHGIIGQSFDGDDVSVSGKEDNYARDTHTLWHPGTAPALVRTSAMAEGAIEGTGDDYEVGHMFDTNFKYSRFDGQANAVCPPRDITKLTGKKVALSDSVARTAGSKDEIIEKFAEMQASGKQETA